MKLSTNIVKLQEGVDEDVSSRVLTQRVLMRALTIVNHVRTWFCIFCPNFNFRRKRLLIINFHEKLNKIAYTLETDGNCVRESTPKLQSPFIFSKTFYIKYSHQIFFLHTLNNKWKMGTSGMQLQIQLYFFPLKKYLFLPVYLAFSYSLAVFFFPVEQC